MGAVNLVAMSIYYDYPDRSDRRLHIGDACPPTGACTGHPGSSHAGCKAMDTDYYTWGPNNTTQYRPTGNVSDELRTITKIWNDVCSDLKTDVFDWERNYILLVRLRDVFPRGQFSTQNILKDYMVAEAEKKFGRRDDKLEVFKRRVGVDLGNKYNHHTHFHLNLAYDPNWNFNTEEWRDYR